MRGRRRWTASIVVVVALAAIGSAVTATAQPSASASATKSPIVIGWAFDGKGAMAPFDGPALAAAKIRIGYWNGKGGVLGHRIVLKTCDT